MFQRREFLAALGLGVGSLTLTGVGSPVFSPPRLALNRDRLLGMFAMGAYGDALGSWNEWHGGLSGAIEDPQKAALRGSGKVATNPWGYWIANDGQKPVVTDDTAFRVTILHPFMRHCLEQQLPITEDGMWHWAAEGKPHSLTHIQTMRLKQARDWNAMLKAADNQKQHLFYTPAEPVVFGLYTALETAAVHLNKSPAKVYLHFQAFSKLDQGSGRALTGLLAAVIAEAHKADDISLGQFASWWEATVDSLLDQFMDSDPNEELKRLIHLKQEAVALADTWPPNLPQQFVSHLRRTHFHDPRFDTKKQRPYLSELFWVQMCAVVTYAKEDDALILRILASAAGDSDTMASMMGSMMGARYGRTLCGKIASLGKLIESDLKAIEAVLSQDFEVELAESAKVFEGLAKLTCDTTL